MNLAAGLAFVRGRGARRPAVVAFDLGCVPLAPEIETPLLLHGPRPDASAATLSAHGWTLAPLAAASADVDVLVIIDTSHFGLIMRAAEAMSRRGVLVVPADPDAVVDPDLRGVRRDADRLADDR